MTMTQKRPLRILVGIRGNGQSADAYYRARAPWSVVQYWVNARLQEPEIEIKLQRLDTDLVAWADVVIAQRPNESLDEIIIAEAQRLGKPVIVDVDDNLFDIPGSAGDIYDHYLQRGSLAIKAPLAFHKRCLQRADVVTVPTAELGEILAQRIGKPDLDYRVLPNAVMRCDWDWMPHIVPQWGIPEAGGDPPVTVGWFGYCYHWDDLRDVMPTLNEVICSTNSRLVIMGFPEIVSVMPESLRERTYLEECVPFPEFQAIRQLVKTFDIGLCPLTESDFNRGKSPLKAFQYGAAGAVPVCSAPVYGRVCGLQELGLVEDTWDGFGARLAQLIEDADLRQDLAGRWQERVFAEHCYEALEPETNAPLAVRWLEFVKELADES